MTWRVFDSVRAAIFGFIVFLMRSRLADIHHRVHEEDSATPLNSDDVIATPSEKKPQ